MVAAGGRLRGISFFICLGQRKTATTMPPSPRSTNGKEGHEMAENKKGLTPAQMRFLVAILEERTIEAACRKTDTPRRTGDRWRMLPEFKAELDRREGELLDTLAARLMQTLPAVEAVFVQVMADKGQPPGVRVRAASELAGLALRLFEARNLDRRLTALEQASGAL